MVLAAWLKGLALGGGLIIAIGAQNAHVLRMGLQRQHVALTVAICIVGDVLLICAGAAGMGALIERHATLTEVARWGGAAFLCWYGLRAWRSAFANASLHVATGALPQHWPAALMTVAALTWLNPHVYLDTVVLLGAVAGQQSTDARPWFVLGAICASIMWFTTLGYGARLLSPWFATARAWRILDVIIGCVMLALAASLLLSAR